MNSHLTGKSYLRQTQANICQRRQAANLPQTYGWLYTGQQPDYDLPVYEKDGVKLMRHPAGDCWLVQWLGRCYRSEAHVSDLSVNMLKIQIELDINKEVAEERG